MSYLLITSREKFILELMSVIDIETTVIEFLRSESKRFDTRYAGEADGSIKVRDSLAILFVNAISSN